jgi:hypothetical protein
MPAPGGELVRVESCFGADVAVVYSLSGEKRGELQE